MQYHHPSHLVLRFPIIHNIAEKMTTKYETVVLFLLQYVCNFHKPRKENQRSQLKDDDHW